MFAAAHAACFSMAFFAACSLVVPVLLSLVGDVALLWPREGFLPGLVAFLLAHLAYLAAFTRVQPLAARRAPLPRPRSGPPASAR